MAKHRSYRTHIHSTGLKLARLKAEAGVLAFTTVTLPIALLAKAISERLTQFDF